MRAVTNAADAQEILAVNVKAQNDVSFTANVINSFYTEPISNELYDAGYRICGCVRAYFGGAPIIAIMDSNVGSPRDNQARIRAMSNSTHTVSKDSTAFYLLLAR